MVSLTLLFVDLTHGDVTLPQPAQALVIGGAGTLIVDLAGGGGVDNTDVTMAVSAGLLAIPAKRIKAVSTATGIVALI